MRSQLKSSLTRSSRKPINYYKSLTNQHLLLENLYQKFELQNLEDYLTITSQKFIDNGGKSLITNYYSNSMYKMLTSLYPNYPWPSNVTKFQIHSYFSSLENQKEFMDNLFSQLNLNSFDDWLQITRKKLVKNGAKSLLQVYYNNDMKSILLSIYPNYPWNFDSHDIKIHTKNEFFRSYDNQTKFMNNLYHILQLKSLDDWLNVSRNTINRHGGNGLLQLYSNSMEKLLNSIYPLHSWYFQRLYKQTNTSYFRSIENQRNFVDQFFIACKLQTFDDFLSISATRLFEFGGKKLLSHYSNDIRKMFIHLYPNYPWPSQNTFKLKFQSHNYFLSLKNQREFMDQLYYQFGLSSMEGWSKITKKKIIKNGGKSLLTTYYSTNIQKLLKTVYPYYPWNFGENDFKYKRPPQSILFLRKIIHYVIDYFKIKQKKDWYRVSSKLRVYSSSVNQYHLTDRIIHLSQRSKKKEKMKVIDIFKALSLIFPHDKWKRKYFLFRSKTSIQRLLFIYSLSLFPSVILYENYRHPHQRLFVENFQYENREVLSASNLLEYDIFIPSLNLAIEYQGEQHYDDIPPFCSSALYQARDKVKQEFSDLYSIQLITIPYWWDKSFSSFLSTLYSALNIQSFATMKNM